MSKPNPRTANGHRRRQVRAAVLAEEHDCHLCGQPVDKTLTMIWGQHGPRCQTPDCPGCVPHPLRAEVDEIVAVAQGGSPIQRSNCRLSHRVCNLGKAQAIASQNEPGGKPTVAGTVPFPVHAFASLQRPARQRQGGGGHPLEHLHGPPAGTGPFSP